MNYKDLLFFHQNKLFIIDFIFAKHRCEPKLELLFPFQNEAEIRFSNFGSRTKILTYQITTRGNVSSYSAFSYSI